MQIKYTIETESFEYNPSKYTIEEAWADDRHDHYNKTLEMFDTLEEAREALQRYLPADTHQYSWKLACATVYYIMEAEYDLNDDGEWEFISGGDVWDFSCTDIEEDEEEEEEDDE